MKKIVLLLMVLNVGMIVNANGTAAKNDIKRKIQNGTPSYVKLSDSSRIGDTDYYAYIPYLSITYGPGAFQSGTSWSLWEGNRKANFLGYRITLIEVSRSGVVVQEAKSGSRLGYSKVKELAKMVGAGELNVRVVIQAKYRTSWGEVLYSDSCISSKVYKLDFAPPDPPVINIDGSESKIYDPNVSTHGKYSYKNRKYYFVGKENVKISVGNLNDAESGKGQLIGKLSRFLGIERIFGFLGWSYYRYTGVDNNLISTNTKHKVAYEKTLNTSSWHKDSVYKISLYHYDKSDNYSTTETLLHTDFSPPEIDIEKISITYATTTDLDWYKANISTKVTDEGAGVDRERVELLIPRDLVSSKMKEKNNTKLKIANSDYYKIALDGKDGTFSTPLIINAGQTIDAKIRAYDNVSNLVEEDITLAISSLPGIKLSSIDYNASSKHYSFPYTINYTETGEGVKYINFTLSKRHYAGDTITIPISLYNSNYGDDEKHIYIFPPSDSAKFEPHAEYSVTGMTVFDNGKEVVLPAANPNFDNGKEVVLPAANPNIIDIIKVSNRSIFDEDNLVSIYHKINDKKGDEYDLSQYIDYRYDNYNKKTTYPGEVNGKIELPITVNESGEIIPVVLKLDTQRDVEGDILELQYQDKNGNYISGRNVGNAHILEIPVETEEIRLIEYFVDIYGNKMADMEKYKAEGDSHIYAYYTNFEVRRTFPFDAENFKIKIQGNGALADGTPASQGSFEYDIKTTGEDPYIQSVTVFDATDINIGDIADVSVLTQLTTSAFQSAVSSDYSHTDGRFSIPIDNDTAAYKTIVFYFKDKAGNSAIRTKRVYVDREAPPDVFGSLTEDTNNPILLKQSDKISFDYNKAEKTLKIDFTDLFAEPSNNNTNNYKVSADYPESNPITSDYESDLKTITFTLEDAFQPNAEIEGLEMGLKDAAGNETLRKVKVYTPAVLNSHGSTEPVWQAYLKADSSWETQELRYAVAWSSPNGNDTVEVYNIYDISDYISINDNSDYKNDISSITTRGINNLNIPPISLESGSTTSVATYFSSKDTKKTFALTAVNKNGYQHANDDGFLIFFYAIPNSNPVIKEIISPQYSDGEVHYWNDSTTIDIDVSDADGTDHLHYEVILETGNASYVYKNDDTKSKFSLSNILAKAVLLDNLQSDSSNPIRLVSGAAYALSMKVIDTWGQESNSKTGEGVEFGPDGFIYDTKAPVISTGEGLGLDKREGYHYGIGDFRVKITDAVSGLGSYEASINGESKIIQKTSDEDIFYITDMPDGSGMKLRLTVRDNIENSENYVITIDKDSIAPVLSEFTTSASAADGNYVLGGLDQFPFSLKWSDEISGAYKLEYVLSAITESPDGESFTYNGEYVASAPEKPGNEQTWSGFLSFPSSIQESVEYSLKMRLYDGAGNASELLGLDKPLVIDRTGPGVRISVISGFTENAGIYYLTASNPSLGVISGGDEDSDAGDISYLYRIQDDAENDYIEIEDLGILAAVLNEGDGCLLQVKVRDGAGNYGYSRPLTVIKDFEAPILDSGSVAINGGSPGFSSGERVAFDLSGQDGGSGIAYYLLWIGRDGEEEPSLSSQISGSDENGYVRMNEKHSLLVPPHAEVGTYSIKARAADRAGHLSDEISVSAQLTVNTESKLLLVYDRVSVSSNDTQLAAWWKYFGEGTVNYYRYRVMDAATGLPVRGDWVETPDSGAAVKFDTPLTHGSVYRFEVVAIGDDGKPLGHSVSEGARIDTQAPVILSAEKISLASLRDVGLSWEIEEEGEELSSVMLELVYPDPSAANGEDSTANKDEEQLSANLVYRIQLPLEYAMNDLHIDILEKLTSENAVRPAEGELAQLYLHAADFAGNKDTMYLDSLIMDSSKPPTAEIMDDGAYINPDENDLRFNWEWSPGDPESGIIKTRYKFFRAVDGNQDSADDRVETITDWTEIADDSISIKLKKDETDNGSQVFLAIERENGVGLRSIGISDGIIIDWTGPKLVRADLAVKGVPRNWHAASMGELVLSLNAAAEEGESRIAGYQYKPGYLENGVWKAIESEEIANIDIQDLSQGMGEITYPSNAVRNTLSGKILAYRVEATNLVELVSRPGYTNGIKIYEEIPQVRNLRGSIQNGGLVFTWDIDSAEALNLPEGTLTLTGPDNLARTDSIPSHRRWIRYEGLEEGHYILTISFTDESGPVPASVSKSVTFDITGPEIRSVDHQKYADSRLTFRVVAQDKDNLSGVGRFQYQLTFPDMQNNEWMERNVDGDMLDESLFLRELTDGDSIFLSLIAFDRLGNASETYLSQPILIDKTPPAVTNITQNHLYQVAGTEYDAEKNFIFAGDRIEQVILEAEDNQSGITAYQYRVVPAEGDPLNTEEPAWLPRTISRDEGEVKQLTLADLVLNAGLPFEDGRQYRAEFKVINGAGTLSEAMSSEPFETLLSAPSVTLQEERSGEGREDVGGAVRIIINGNDDLYFHLKEGNSPIAETAWQFFGSQGTIATGGPQAVEAGGELHIPLQVPETTVPGEYSVSISAKGLSGQRRTQNFPIRLNRAPSVYVNDIFTVPGKPVSIEDYKTLDLDGIQSYFLQVIHNGVTIAEWNGSNLEDWKHTFYQRDNSSESEYTLMTSATDIYGLTGSSSGSTVIVQNTSSGDLYTDEVWQGEHRITGPVRVLSGTTLTVKNGTNIFAVMGSGKVPRLIIEEGAQLIHEGGASYGIESLYRNDYWDGIEIAGDANLKNIRVSRAQRGITLLNDSIEYIDNVAFDGNLIGLHLVGTSPEIRWCQFTSNRHYGVKEDFDSRPVLEGNTFQNNFYDYYQNQSGGLVLTGEAVEKMTEMGETVDD